MYRTTCLLDGRIYIGKHKTADLDDGYLGSGKHLLNAIRKHGIQNFQKEVLHVFDNEDEMNLKEAELVTEEFCSRKDTYNLCPGGKGGWGYINQHQLIKWHRDPKRHAVVLEKISKSVSKTALRVEYKLSLRERYVNKTKQSMQEGKNRKYPDGVWFGKKHSDESKAKQSAKMKGRFCGRDSSQFGSKWMNDGISVKKVSSVEIQSYLNRGYRFGRTV